MFNFLIHLTLTVTIPIPNPQLNHQLDPQMIILLTIIRSADLLHLGMMILLILLIPLIFVLLLLHKSPNNVGPPESLIH